MVLDTTETRLNRAESDIETLRTTQTNILNHLDGYSKTLNETRDIAAENRERLGSIEDRQKRMDDRQQDMANDLKRNSDRLKRVEDRLDNVERVLLENTAAIRENRLILLSLAENAGLTIAKPEDED